jgi:surfeit locus 1 family protein
VVLALIFARLGIWQVDRLQQRRARNTEVRARYAAAPVPFERLGDTLSYRRVVVTGTPDYANEVVLTGRSRDGSPGVYFLTPVRPPAGDTAIIVIRGWAYSPDAATIDQTRWRESRTSFSGYVSTLAEGPATPSSRGTRAIRTLTAAGVRSFVTYPVSSRYVVSQDQQADTTPARLPPPALDDGPHLSYAIQWFSFATIAVVGAGVVAARARVSPQRTNRAEVD